MMSPGEYQVLQEIRDHLESLNGNIRLLITSVNGVGTDLRDQLKLTPSGTVIPRKRHEAEHDPILFTLTLSTRIRNILAGLRICTLRDLLDTKVVSLMGARNFGLTSWKELRKGLGDHYGFWIPWPSSKYYKTEATFRVTAVHSHKDPNQ